MQLTAEEDGGGTRHLTKSSHSRAWLLVCRFVCQRLVALGGLPAILIAIAANFDCRAAVNCSCMSKHRTAF